MTPIEKLHAIRRSGGTVITPGLADSTLATFIQTDSTLVDAINLAHTAFEELQRTHGELLSMDEADQLTTIQEGLVNFYAQDAVNPYASLAAKGPWIVTLKGAVIHDSGGYGMLGFGHAPDQILEAMNRPHVMANVMTPNVSQMKLVVALRKELGHTRGAPAFQEFLCLNSGSEAVTVAARISDINAKTMTDPGGRHAGKPIRILALEGGFHGRTDRPAQYSDSTRKTYTSHLASFRDRDNLWVVEPNNVQHLHEVYERADREGVFIESFFMEPVMGEGNPGEGMTPEFYAAARKLTRQHGSLLLVDSIQAGLRAHGCLSIVDYPGFESVDAPDMETYSKALNAGQYPLSVLAMQSDTASIYRRGIYGNTMTTNPRAMDVACAVLDQVTDEVRSNIRSKGQEFLAKLGALKDELGGLITKVQGTGLLFSCELAKEFKAYGTGSIEEYLRHKGIGVIHGGENSLRFTPHFRITSAEVDLVIDAVKDAVINGPRRQPDLAKAG